MVDLALTSADKAGGMCGRIAVLKLCGTQKLLRSGAEAPSFLACSGTAEAVPFHSATPWLKQLFNLASSGIVRRGSGQASGVVPLLSRTRRTGVSALHWIPEIPALSLPRQGRGTLRSSRSSLWDWLGEGGATLAEFAFTLPLLVALLYAVFDFGSALSLKQKLGSAVYESARAGASQGTGDLSNGNVGTSVGGSVANLRDTVANSLLGSGVSDCGLLGGGTLVPTPAAFRWVYTASTGCPGTLKLTIERQDVVTAASGGVNLKMIYTHVYLEYPFQWRLAKVIGFLNPGGSLPGLTLIKVDAAMSNLS